MHELRSPHGPSCPCAPGPSRQRPAQPHALRPSPPRTYAPRPPSSCRPVPPCPCACVTPSLPRQPPRRLGRRGLHCHAPGTAGRAVGARARAQAERAKGQHRVGALPRSAPYSAAAARSAGSCRLPAHAGRACPPSRNARACGARAGAATHYGALPPHDVLPNVAKLLDSDGLNKEVARAVGHAPQHGAVLAIGRHHWGMGAERDGARGRVSTA
jgi:hypothetical protein